MSLKTNSGDNGYDGIYQTNDDEKVGETKSALYIRRCDRTNSSS